MKVLERLRRRNRPSKKPSGTVQPPDGGWGWIVCAAGFLTQFILLGTMNNFGILYVTLFKYFNSGASATSLIGSINYGTMFFSGPVAAAFSAKYGCRPVSMFGSLLFAAGLISSSFAPSIYVLYITYGIMIGFGASLCYFSTIVAVGQYFYKRLSLANGIISSGSGVGSLVMGPVMHNLIKYLGWRNTLRVYSGMLVVVFFSALFYRPINTHVHPTKKEDKNKRAKFIDMSIFRNKAYVIWCVSLAVFILGYFVPFVHLVKYAHNNGVSDDDSSFLIGIMSIGSTFGRLFFGRLSDHPRVNRLYVYQLSILMMGIANTLLPLMKTYATILCYCVVWGTFEGCYVALCAVLTADIVGRDKLSSGVGMLFGLKSIPLTGGPALAGFIYDVSQSYDVAFYIAGALCTLCCCIMFLIPLYMPEQGEEVVEYIDDKYAEAMQGYEDGILDNERRSDDSAYVSGQPSTTLIDRPRPQSSYLSPYRDTSLVPSPSTLSVRGTMSRSTASLTAKHSMGIPKLAKSSEFGSMTTIPIIPNSGAYRSLQQLPVHGSCGSLRNIQRQSAKPKGSVDPIPVIVVHDDVHRNLVDSADIEDTISALPGKEAVI